MYGCSMHQPVEWDFSEMDFQCPLIANDTGVLTTQQQQQDTQGIVMSHGMTAFHHGYGGSWPSMHQPIADFDSPPSAPKLLTQTSSQPGASATPAPSAAGQTSREPAKRERSARRAKATLRPQQQQMLELQKKLDVLLQEHTVVEAENQRLKTRLRVLEAVLPVREQQARWAQSRPVKPSPQDAMHAKIASLLDLATSGPSSCATSPRRLETANMSGSFGAPRMAGDDECGNGSGITLNRVSSLQLQDTLVPGSPAQAPAAADAAPCASCSSCNPLRAYSDFVGATAGGIAAAACGPAGTVGGTSRCSTEPHPQGESETRWMDTWRAWIREAALLLQAHDARPNEHYVRRLEEAFTKLKSEVVYLDLKHPELICNMRCVNLETGAEQEVPPESFWALVAAGMRLTPQQVANCKSALALYRERMSVVLGERRGLTAQLSSCLGTLQLDEAEGRAAPGSMRREQLTLQAEEVAAALDANVAAEGHTTALARDLLGSNLFSRVQCARGSVLSYPYFPDALAIISAAVTEAEKDEMVPTPEPGSAALTGTLTGAQPIALPALS